MNLRRPFNRMLGAFVFAFALGAAPVALADQADTTPSTVQIVQPADGGVPMATGPNNPSPRGSSWMRSGATDDLAPVPPAQSTETVGDDQLYAAGPNDNRRGSSWM